MTETPDLAALPQGDPGLLASPLAQRLLAAPVPVRLAYTALDGTPRLVPINFVWTGDELVMGAFAGTYKLPALAAHPRVAASIDTAAGAPQVLLLRGDVTLREVDGVLPEYAAAQRKTMGDELSDAYLAALDQPGLRMVRIGLVPAWVGVLDFAQRFPERTPAAVLAAMGAPT